MVPSFTRKLASTVGQGRIARKAMLPEEVRALIRIGAGGPYTIIAWPCTADERLLQLVNMRDPDELVTAACAGFIAYLCERMPGAWHRCYVFTAVHRLSDAILSAWDLRRWSSQVQELTTARADGGTGKPHCMVWRVVEDFTLRVDSDGTLGGRPLPHVADEQTALLNFTNDGDNIHHVVGISPIDMAARRAGL